MATTVPASASHIVAAPGPVYKLSDDEPTTVEERAARDLRDATALLDSAWHAVARMGEEAQGLACMSARRAIERARVALETAIERLPYQAPRRVVRVAGLEVDFVALAGRYDGSLLVLSVKETELLCRLARDPGAVVARRDLLKSIWRHRRYPTAGSLDTVAVGLRGAIVAAGAPRGVFVVCCRGVGYSLVAPDE